MLEFHEITDRDIPLIAPYLYKNSGRLCDFTPVNLALWAGYFYKAYAVTEDMLYLQLCTEEGEEAYAVPIGNGDRTAALRYLTACVKKENKPLCFSLISEEELPILREVFGNSIVPVGERQWCDYVYDARTMRDYEGKAYAKQRNHMRRFCRQYPSYRAERMTKSHIPDIQRLLKTFSRIRKKEDPLAEKEIALTEKALERMEVLSLFGVVLYVDNIPVGFSAGCRSENTVYVNFEKADTSYEGVYQMLVYTFLQEFVTTDILFVNREEDCGDEGLRRSKTAYHPTELLNKYTVTIL